MPRGAPLSGGNVRRQRAEVGLPVGISQRHPESTDVQCRSRRVEPFPLLETWTGHQDQQPIASRLPQNGHADSRETKRTAAGGMKLCAIRTGPLLPDPLGRGRPGVTGRGIGCSASTQRVICSAYTPNVLR
jgi:hypothetical protein